MARYRNDVNVPLNYGERGPWVEPGGEFSTEDYPAIAAEQLASHLASGFISEVPSHPLIDELHVHTSSAVFERLSAHATRADE